jgi:hypothetical protein
MNTAIREIIFGQKREIRYWQVTDNTETLLPNSTNSLLEMIFPCGFYLSSV